MSRDTKTKVLVVCAAVAVYVGLWPLFWSQAGSSLSILSLIPVVAASWLFGTAWGMAVAGFVVTPITLWLFVVVGRLTVGEALDQGVTFGAVALLVTAAIAGAARRYLQRFVAESDERRRAFEELESTTGRFRSVFYDAPIGMVLCAEDGTIEAANRAFADLTRSSEDRLTGGCFVEWIHPEDRDLLASPLALKASEPALEVRVVNQISGFTWTVISMSPIRTAGDLSGYEIVHVADISDRRQAQEALQNLVRAKDEFIASVSHELRTPLTAVYGLASELSDHGTFIGGPERDELIAVIAEQSGEVAAIVEDLLVSARADIDQLGVAPEPVDLGEEVERVLAALPGYRDIAVTLSGAGRAVADPARLRQIIRNLLTNAFRYGGDRVEIELGRAPARIVVSDNGAGIPQDERERIFEPYYRSHEREGQPASVGLGLTVSRKLARLMGGDLSYSYHEGRSRFLLQLPDLHTTAGIPGHDRSLGRSKDSLS